MAVSSDDFTLPVGVLPYDAYLHIPDHPGECSDSKHTEWIEVKQYRHDIDQKIAASYSASGAPTSGQADHSFFWFCKEIDKTTPKLLLSMLNGKAIPEAKLEICAQTGDKQTFLAVTMKNLVVAAVRTLAIPVPEPGESLQISKPCEWVGLAYAQIEWVYTVLDHETGAVKGQIVSHWDRKNNTGG